MPPGATFAYIETVDAQHENAVKAWSGGAEVSVGPGAIVRSPRTSNGPDAPVRPVCGATVTVR